MPRVLIIDDDSSICRIMTTIVRQHGHEVLCAPTLGQGLASLAESPADLVLLDVNLPDGNGLDIIPDIHRQHPRPDIVVMTSQADPDGAELAIQSGAWDYIQKADSPKAIGHRITRVLEYRANMNTIADPVQIDRTGIVGSSRPLLQALDQMAQTVSSDAGVLITGETGTGKELFAQAVHNNSPRRNENFVVVDCAALPKTLVESMLFGHVKGAYTGAEGAREGLIAQADGGTLFLDEVGEMPLDVQKSFLRVLESKRFRPIGGKQEQQSNFRIIASTNQNLDDMVRQGTFRKDLLYRLRTFHLELPPIRLRREDIKEIARHHLHRLNSLYGWESKALSAEFLALLDTYEWPGNVRELVNALEHALAAAQQQDILLDYHLPTRIRAWAARKKLDGVKPKSAAAGAFGVSGTLPPLQAYREQAIEQAESDYLGALMTAADGNIGKACRLSGVSRSRLYELLKKYAISTG